MAGRWAASQQLVRQAFSILRQDKELVWFPIWSALLSLLFLASFVIPLSLVVGTENASEMTQRPAGLAIMFVYYLVLSFITTFFTTALAACAIHRLEGGNPTVSYGLQAARERVGKIFAWATLSATVGVLLRIIENKGGIFGKIFSVLAGMAWSLVTFFIVPVMLLEKLSIGQSIKRSGELFRKTWGENAIGNVTIGLFFLPFFLGGLFLFGILIAFLAGTGAGIIGIILGCLLLVAYFLTLSVVSSAMQGIFVAALYRYVTTGTPPPGFDPEVVQNAFRKKGSPAVTPTTPTSFSG